MSLENWVRGKKFAQQTVNSLTSCLPALRKCVAFTLAEVLITIGVIGVVAALTLPNLIHKVQDRVTISRLRKSYLVLEQAFRRAVDDYGPVDTWCDADKYRGGYRDECAQLIPQIMSQYISMQKSTIRVKYKNRVKSDFFAVSAHADTTTFVSNDGTILYFRITPASNSNVLWCKAKKYTENSGRYNHCGTILVDVSGKSKPNVNNKDLFGFKIYQDGIAPMGNRADERSSYYYGFWGACKDDVGSPGACAGWVLEIGNMDYQYCDDLSYSGKTQCH